MGVACVELPHVGGVGVLVGESDADSVDGEIPRAGFRVGLGGNVVDSLEGL